MNLNYFQVAASATWWRERRFKFDDSRDPPPPFLKMKLFFALYLGVVAAAAKPHIVFMLVDDWGWGNVGWHRPGFNETVTPNLDSLVASGVQLTSQYVRARAAWRTYRAAANSARLSFSRVRRFTSIAAPPVAPSKVGGFQFT